jgi:ribose/xylose/arabinose/galactoside ABC-type transport system permease subunit
MRTHHIELTLAIIILAVGLVLIVAAPRFFEPANLIDIVLANLPILIVALCASIVILTGEIDISVGSTFAVCSVLAGTLATWGLPLPATVAATLIVGAAIGATNGALVACFHVPSIVVTLAAMVAFRDGLRWITEGAWVQNLPPGFQWLGLTQQSYPLALFAVVMALTAATAWMLGHTRAGRFVYAVGSSPEAARLAAIDVSTLRFVVFVAAGMFTALAALANAVRFNQIPSNTGLGLEMKVIAAVVVGGAAITGGRGTVLGTLLGVVLLGVLGPALTFLGASAYWERALQGLIILAAVAIEAMGRLRLARSERPATGMHRELA